MDMFTLHIIPYCTCADLMMKHAMHVQHYYHVCIRLNDLVKSLNRKIRNIIKVRTVGNDVRVDAAVFFRVESGRERAQFHGMME